MDNYVCYFNRIKIRFQEDKMRSIRMIMILTALSLLCGCGTVSNDNSVKVGVIMPQTGEFATFGGRALNGIKLYAGMYNETHDKKLELIIIDNQSTPQGTLRAYHKLVKEYNVPFVIGAYSSANTMVLKPYAAQWQVPVITPTATSDVITLNNSYMFRTCFSDSAQGEALGRFAKGRMNISRLGILLDVDENGEYSKGLGRALGRSFELAGGRVMIEEGYSSDTKSFEPQLRRVIKRKVNGIFAPTYCDEAVKIIKAARKLGFTDKVFGGDGWDEPEVMKKSGDAIVGCFFSAMFSPRYKSPVVRGFVARYQKDYGQTPGSCAAQGYDTVAIVVEAMKLTNEKRDFRQSLLAIQDFYGVTGPISFEEDGNALKNVFVEEVYKKFDGSCDRNLIGIITPRK